MPEPLYAPRRAARVSRHPLRNDIDYQVRSWGLPADVAPERPPLVIAHGWMDVGASFQFLVDHLAEERHVLAFDWRGFGASRGPAPVDSYWFPDYLGDLDALLERLFPDTPVDLLGHSMGGNVVMNYCGVRPERIRRVINLEGFGLPRTRPQDAPARLRQWLDELGRPQALRSFASVEAVAEHLRRKSPRLLPQRAAWLARQWAELRDDGRWHVLGDPAHRRVNPILYQADEALACWRAITAPVLWVEGGMTDSERWAGDRYPRDEFEQRLAQVSRLSRAVLPDCGHMLHLEQPEALARAVEAFLNRPMRAAEDL